MRKLRYFKKVVVNNWPIGRTGCKFIRASAKIIELIGQKYNLTIDAVARSEKTITALEATRKHTNLKFFQITYNSGLKVKFINQNKEITKKIIWLHNFRWSPRYDIAIFSDDWQVFTLLAML